MSGACSGIATSIYFMIFVSSNECTNNATTGAAHDDAYRAPGQRARSDRAKPAHPNDHHTISPNPLFFFITLEPGVE